MINKKTLKKLQYEDILNQIASFSVSAVAKRKVLQPLPSENFDEAQNLLQETRQAYNLFQFETSFDLAVDDVKETCSLAKVGYCLSMGQLLQIMRTLRTSRNLQTSWCTVYCVDVSL